ncbi:MAG: hypothetical protein K0S53_3405, partial [Bacteroidetes bacterium]|nr:hypothetical protein [Bacteroidota bacterium]
KASTGTWKLSHDTITVNLSDNASWYFVILKASNNRITLKHWWESSDPIELQETQD